MDGIFQPVIVDDVADSQGNGDYCQDDGKNVGQDKEKGHGSQEEQGSEQGDQEMDVSV